VPTNNTVKVKQDTLPLQRVRELEAALEARGRGARPPGSKESTQRHSWLYRFFFEP